jgi:hypothetical protein
MADTPALLTPGDLPAITLDSIRVMPREELERYLSDFSVEELRQATELWKIYAARKPLIDFEANNG